MMFSAYEAHHPPTAFWKPRLLGCSDGKFVQPNAISYAQQLLLLVRQHHQAMVQLRQDSFHSHNHFVTRFMSPIGGLIHRAAHRWKTLMPIIKLIGHEISINGDITSTMSTVRLALGQILLGMGAWTVIGARVRSQASVRHQDLSTVIGVLSV
jgi:hypothetical protein